MGIPSTSSARDAHAARAWARPMSIQSGLISLIGARVPSVRVRAGRVSKHAGLESGGVRHHRLIPGRIERQLDARLAHRRDALDLVFHVIDEDVAHAAPGGGECDLDLDTAGTVVVSSHLALVNEAEIDDV